MMCLLTSSRAHAAVTIKDVDQSRVSSVEGIGTATVIVYGGTAGTTCGNDTNTTCSSCIHNAGGDTGLIACNDRRINPTLQLVFTVSSTDLDGFPNIATGATNTGGVAAGTILTQVGGASGSVPKTTNGTITIPWGTICANLPIVTATTGTVGAMVGPSCDLAAVGATAASGTFQVGITATQAPGTFATTDQSISVNIALRSGDASATSTAPTGGNGVTYYEFASGDNKGTIGSLKSTPGISFPVFENLRFRWVRVLFEKRASNNTNVWGLINPGSPHFDLEINSAATDVNNLNLSPIVVTQGAGRDSSGNAMSMSISNNSVYDTKVAVVDAARNVEFYTPAANDQDCDNGATSKSADPPIGSGLLECHTIRAAPVVGVLANKVNCFVATAAYGSPMASEVDSFRHFRDTYLIPTKLGLKFVRWYYTHGPAYADFIRPSDTLRALARGFLWLPLQFAKISIAYGLFAGLSFLTFVLVSPLAGLAWALRRRRSAKINA